MSDSDQRIRATFFEPSEDPPWTTGECNTRFTKSMFNTDTILSNPFGSGSITLKYDSDNPESVNTFRKCCNVGYKELVQSIFLNIPITEHILEPDETTPVHIITPRTDIIESPDHVFMDGEQEESAYPLPTVRLTLINVTHVPQLIDQAAYTTGLVIKDADGIFTGDGSNIVTYRSKVADPIFGMVNLRAYIRSISAGELICPIQNMSYYDCNPSGSGADRSYYNTHPGDEYIVQRISDWGISNINLDTEYYNILDTDPSYIPVTFAVEEIRTIDINYERRKGNIVQKTNMFSILSELESLRNNFNYVKIEIIALDDKHSYYVNISNIKIGLVNVLLSDTDSMSYDPTTRTISGVGTATFKHPLHPRWAYCGGYDYPYSGDNKDVPPVLSDNYLGYTDRIGDVPQYDPETILPSFNYGEVKFRHFVSRFPIQGNIVAHSYVDRPDNYVGNENFPVYGHNCRDRVMHELYSQTCVDTGHTYQRDCSANEWVVGTGVPHYPIIMTNVTVPLPQHDPTIQLSLTLSRKNYNATDTVKTIIIGSTDGVTIESGNNIICDRLDNWNRPREIRRLIDDPEWEHGVPGYAHNANVKKFDDALTESFFWDTAELTVTLGNTNSSITINSMTLYANNDEPNSGTAVSPRRESYVTHRSGSINPAWHKIVYPEEVYHSPGETVWSDTFTQRTIWTFNDVNYVDVGVTQSWDLFMNGLYDRWLTAPHKMWLIIRVNGVEYDRIENHSIEYKQGMMWMKQAMSQRTHISANGTRVNLVRKSTVEVEFTVFAHWFSIYPSGIEYTHIELKCIHMGHVLPVVNQFTFVYSENSCVIDNVIYIMPGKPIKLYLESKFAISSIECAFASLDGSGGRTTMISVTQNENKMVYPFKIFTIPHPMNGSPGSANLRILRATAKNSAGVSTAYLKRGSNNQVFLLCQSPTSDEVSLSISEAAVGEIIRVVKSSSDTVIQNIRIIGNDVQSQACSKYPLFNYLTKKYTVDNGINTNLTINTPGNYSVVIIYGENYQVTELPLAITWPLPVTPTITQSGTSSSVIITIDFEKPFSDVSVDCHCIQYTTDIEVLREQRACYRGHYPTYEALILDIPAGHNMDYALIGSTDIIYVWNGSSWVIDNDIPEPEIEQIFDLGEKGIPPYCVDDDDTPRHISDSIWEEKWDTYPYLVITTNTWGDYRILYRGIGPGGTNEVPFTFSVR